MSPKQPNEMHPLADIDKIYFINLDKDRERRDLIEQRVSEGDVIDCIFEPITSV